MPAARAQRILREVVLCRVRFRARGDRGEHRVHGSDPSEAVRGVLKPGEQIVWCGRPDIDAAFGVLFGARELRRDCARMNQ